MPHREKVTYLRVPGELEEHMVGLHQAVGVHGLEVDDTGPQFTYTPGGQEARPFETPPVAGLERQFYPPPEAWVEEGGAPRLARGTSTYSVGQREVGEDLYQNNARQQVPVPLCLCRHVY